MERSRVRDLISYVKSESEERRLEYTYINTVTNKPTWNFLDSPFFGTKGMARDFEFIIPKQTEDKYGNLEEIDLKMKDYLKEKFSNKKEGIIIVEMGGPGVNLVKDINSVCKVKKSFALTLDVGFNLAKSEECFKEKNIPLNHEIILGDMFLSQKFLELKNKLKGEKVDFLIERMRAGTEFLSDSSCHPFWYYEQLNNWYQLLSLGGIMLVEIPYYAPLDYPVIRNWIDFLKRNKEVKLNNNRSLSYLKIEKISDNLKSLPFTHSQIKNEIRNFLLD